jgi:hypothetical protein
MAMVPCLYWTLIPVSSNNKIEIVILFKVVLNKRSYPHPPQGEISGLVK